MLSAFMNKFRDAERESELLVVTWSIGRLLKAETLNPFVMEWKNKWLNSSPDLIKLSGRGFHQAQLQAEIIWRREELERVESNIS